MNTKKVPTVLICITPGSPAHATRVVETGAVAPGHEPAAAAAVETLRKEIRP